MAIDDHPKAGQISPLVNSTIKKIAEAHQDIIAELRKLDPMKTAATFAGLLAMPELQANCLRIEALVHLAVACCEGRMAPSKGFVLRAFESLGRGYCGRMEDPSEDVFVTLVNTPRGNFRIFEGIRESTGFHLQRILDIVESMPDRAPFNMTRDSIECLLKLSHAVATRAGVRENSLGQEIPVATLPKGVAERLSRARGLAWFSEDDLARLQIPKASLSKFAFSPSDRSELLDQSMGNTSLERRPIALQGQSVHLLLPTAVASAITRLVIELALSMGLADTLEHALSNEFSQLFYETPILGRRLRAPIEFQRIPGGRIAAMMTEVDPGRFLHFVFFVDGLNGFLPDGLNGTNADPDSLSAALTWHLDRAAAEAKKQTAFRDGISLFVGCGFGRGMNLVLRSDLPEHWRLESIAAHDLVTLNWLSGFDALSLWRMLDSQRAIQEQGAILFNVNGLLNLVAWSRQLGGHLVPHGHLPDEFVIAGSQSTLLIRQNAIRDLRHSVMTEWNPRRVLDPKGRWVKVRKLDKGEFDEDKYAPLYGSEEDVREGRLRGVYAAPNRSWWIEIDAPENSPNKMVYEHWMMLCIWLRRVAPVLDQAYDALPPGPFSFHVNFAEIIGTTHEAVKPKNAEELRSLVEVSAEAGSSSVRINVGRGFDDGFSQPDNVAERALVEALVAGTATAGGENGDVNKQAILVAQICPNAQARWIHRFQARFFRDYAGSEMQTASVLIDPMDDAACRIGLGWKVRSRNAGPEVSGVSECTSYLNDVVRAVLDDLCASLHSVDRHSLARDILANHEVAAHERDVWKHTAQANLALRDDKNAAVYAIVEHLSRLNACFIASRILLEAVICECPLQGGLAPGRLDLSRAMSLAMMAYYLGGWSDAIHWGAMEPRVRITPLGDVHVNNDFMDTIYQPFGRVVGEEEVRYAADSYANLYTPVNVVPSVTGILEDKFLDAWEAEYGSSLDCIRAFLEKLEDAGRHPLNVSLSLPRSALIGMLSTAGSISSEDASATLNMLTLVPRPTWRTVSGEFKDKDWFPWRFRRRLSVLRRPFIQIDTEDDPTILFAPGLVREALFVVAGLFHSGGISSSQAKSPQMCKWIGHANNTQRTEFNSTVALRMRELGWQVERGIKLTKLLGRSLDRDYGDIDVLAWRPDSGKVLVMECKDLQFHKTLGEIAEQLADFRGEVGTDGKPDHLRRHLNRLEVLTADQALVSKALKLASPIEMRGHLVFKNPVPMRFAWEKMASRIHLSLFAELDKL